MKKVRILNYFDIIQQNYKCEQSNTWDLFLTLGEGGCSISITFFYRLIQELNFLDFRFFAQMNERVTQIQKKFAEIQFGF